MASERILLGDSDSERRRTLAAMLRADGATIVEADCSASAIACLEQDTVSLVLAVASSNDTDAFSLCAMISGRVGWDTPPVLILLDRNDSHLADVALHTGAADLIKIPCSGAWLLCRVRHHLALAQASRDVRRSQLAHSHAERLARIGSWEWDTDTVLLAGGGLVGPPSGDEGDRRGGRSRSAARDSDRVGM
jgi:DNA-binding response OmpR family regulator